MDLAILPGKMIAVALSSVLSYAPGVLRVQNAQPARATTLTMGVESELGATPPLGYWDPLGLVRDWRPRTCTSTLHLSLHRRLLPPPRAGSATRAEPRPPPVGSP